MKVTVVGSHLCPDTLYAYSSLLQQGLKLILRIFYPAMQILKQYLNLRDNSDLYAQIRGTECLGIPCFIKEDGNVTLDLSEVLK